MSGGELLPRTKAFALRVMRVVENLPRTEASKVIAYQLMKSGTSVGANYRAACRARSPAEFRAKMGIVEEEADESVYWLELLQESGTIPQERLSQLIQEGNEIVSMVVASIRTSRQTSKSNRMKR